MAAQWIFHPSRFTGCPADCFSPNKSEAQRALMFAALQHSSCLLTGLCPPYCEDIQAAIRGIEALGAAVRREPEGLRVLPHAVPVKNAAEWDAGSCATAFRMLTVLFVSREIPFRVWMNPDLRARPMEPLRKLLQRNGGSITFGREKGRDFADVEPGHWADVQSSDTDITSQVLSGLIIARTPVIMNACRESEENPYVRLTYQMSERFGYRYVRTPQGALEIRDVFGSPDQEPREYPIAPDSTQLCYAECMSRFGDGETPEYTSNEMLRWFRGVLPHESACPLEADCAPYPDLVPLLAAAALKLPGESVLRGVSRLQYKECDRLNALTEYLSLLEVPCSVSENRDELRITGGGHIEGGFTAGSYGDHRMVMFLSLAALIADRPITVLGADSIRKSWSGFPKSYTRMGGRIDPFPEDHSNNEDSDE